MKRVVKIVLVLLGLAVPGLAGETAILWPSEANVENRFGQAVGISGGVVVVGAPGGSWTSGAAFVFYRDQGGPEAWGEVGRLVAADAAQGDRFGGSVAIDADTIVVGAPDEDTGAPSWGSAYVFQKDAGGPDMWGQVAKLNTSTRAAQDAFGFSVGISGDSIVVGAPGEDGADINTGAVYIFERDLGGLDQWGLAGRIEPGESFAGDGFGEIVAIAGDTIAVGSPNAHLVSCDCDAGAVWVFDRDPGVSSIWLESAKIENPSLDWYGIFGDAVSIDGDTIIVGDQHYRLPGDTIGVVYLHERDQGGAGLWGLVDQLELANAGVDESRWFGEAVSVSGGVAVAGHSWQHEVVALSLRGDVRWGIDGAWTPSQFGLGYGGAVAVHGSTVVIGAPDDNVGGSESGTAFVVDIVVDEFEAVFDDDFETGSLIRWTRTDS